MAILTSGHDEVRYKPPPSPNLKRNSSNINQLVKIIAENQDITAAARQRKVNRLKELRSPYVIAERGVQFISGITERKIIHKRPQNLKSSFPLASRIYRANSDEFKPPKRTSKKVKKSVLTLPNDPTPSPCTVSDLNEHEYHRKNQEGKVGTKRVSNQNRNRRVRKKNFIIYNDRDDVHANMGCSSDETIKHGGDYKIFRNSRANHPVEGEFKAQDVWALLRNINQFQFKPLPPESGESSLTSSGRSKKKNNKVTHYKRPERRLIETCRTEEISYIASFEIDDGNSVRATSPSRSTSLDRVTVINNGDGKRMINKPTLRLQSIKANKPIQTNNRVTSRNINRLTTRSHRKGKENKIVPVNERNKIKERQTNNAGGLGGHVSRASHLSGAKDSVESSNHDRSKYTEDDDFFSVFDNRIASSTNQFSSPRCPSSNSSAAKSPIPSFEKKDNTRGSGKRLLINEYNVSPCDSMMIGRPRLVTTMPSAAAMPKLSQADVKRRLSLMKFPLVILGKDQLSSTIEVPNYEAPQFNGLDKQIWPFMDEWSKNSSENVKIKLNKNIIAINKSRKVNIILNRSKDKKSVETFNNIKKIEPNKRDPQNITVIPPAQLLKKPKPISQIRDKMFKLLYKKSSQNISTTKVDVSDAGTVCNNEHLVELVIKADVFTETKKKCEILPKAPHQFIPLDGKEKMVSMPTKYTKRPWAKGKWASEFIETVIRKIKNGSYYTQDINKICSRGNSDHKAISAQTLSGETQANSNVSEQTIIESCNDASELSLTKDLTEIDPLAAIPGFDEAFTDLKIDSLTMNQISLKHCITNVILQFDVKVQDESTAVTFEFHKPLESCIAPLPDFNNQIQVFKCSTTFVNAVLPAELCTILPRIKRDFIDSRAYERLSLRPLLSKQNDINSKLSLQNSKQTNLNSKLSQQNINVLPLSLPIKTIILNGEFSRVKLSKNPICRKSFLDKAMNGFRRKLKNIRNLLSDVSVKALMFCKVNPKDLGYKDIKSIEPACSRIIEPVLAKTQSCTALQLYKANDVHTCFSHILESLNKYRSFTLHYNCMSFTQTITVTNDLNDILVDMVDPIGKKTMAISMRQLKVDSLFNGFAKHTVKALPGATITEIESSDTVEQDRNHNETVSKKPSLRNVTCTKTSKKRGYIKLYKKCKSSSNISGEKCSTALSKVTNLDEFFQALGTAKTISSIFDGSPSRNILSAVAQMKNWITEITPRQVMLVLLLANKKETPNLVRYRPVILQGIAVNRITRASELDMEIEVIERENLNKLSQYDDNGFLRSMEHNDSLLEELCWIAKTTASDYQKTFDESSEKLLKSLLQKRKKLNPSYLRVMARYVGLGLLKAQNVKN